MSTLVSSALTASNAASARQSNLKNAPMHHHAVADTHPNNTSPICVALRCSTHNRGTCVCRSSPQCHMFQSSPAPHVPHRFCHLLRHTSVRVFTMLPVSLNHLPHVNRRKTHQPYRAHAQFTPFRVWSLSRLTAHPQLTEPIQLSLARPTPAHRSSKPSPHR